MKKWAAIPAVRWSNKKLQDQKHVLFSNLPRPAVGSKTGRKGTATFRLKAHGVASHAGLDPQKGANAIVEIARQIIKLHELNDFEIGTTVTVTTIKGGTTTNVVPAEAECEIDVQICFDGRGGAM